MAETQIATKQQLLKATDQAMAAEKVPEVVRLRVLNRIMYGTPEGR